MSEQAKSLQALRAEIDAIDGKIVALFAARMQIAADVAAYKRAAGIPVLDSAREKALLDRVTALSPTALTEATRALYQKILALSRNYQQALLDTAETE
ncbi:MAG: chorismate mutase [Clostridia bacterium]|nr:chorismate mutase [Clostridia bacterium]